MSTTGTVTRVSEIKSGSGARGVWYKLNVTFDNGDSGAIFDNDRVLNSITIGSVIEYNLKAGDKGNNIKILNIKNGSSENSSGAQESNPTQHNNTQKLIVRQTAFKGAVDIAVSIIPPEGIKEPAIVALVNTLTDRFYDIIMDKTHEVENILE